MVGIARTHSSDGPVFLHKRPTGKGLNEGQVFLYQVYIQKVLDPAFFLGNNSIHLVMINEMDQDVIPLLKKIGLEVRNFRKRDNLTDKELEKRLGMPVEKLKRIEEGKVNISLLDLLVIRKEVAFSWKILKQR
ncbi:helix-turn-helix transcriptional regulator [Flavitalea sp. BT771]|uniref:helix-turn-helix domain-containing protein n=1 Tax=Flavitalea sp. BT771 TaxID=3063329 RepID=UPI0026E22C17|nr:helix-turn-helix transcriptional regulator [Flavitalea sp. BT771]MDO6433305.1 helix-turn-helix transcriptional regulator [Flavitalea sp. BT771]MDV6222790.1 helix-turn-helix transcriptional regulator [Flavitalea sp. BT771]